MINNKKESGVVSIFIVIFTALLVTIVTVSFVSVMIRNQRQATNADLSNSAYDSAMTGVEDAKRLLLMYRQCKDGSSTLSTCSKIVSLIDNPNKSCNTVKQGLYSGNPGDFSEVVIQRQSGDITSQSLDQAYTCVKINYLSDDTEGTIQDGESKLVPFDANGVPFAKVKISWFTRASDAPPFSTLPTTLKFPAKGSWSSNTPPVLRLQMMQTGNALFDVAQFDSDSTTGSNTNTFFLYPFSAGSPEIQYPYTADPRSATGSNIKNPQAVACKNDYSLGGYTCSTIIKLPDPIGGGARKNFYLQLGALYNKTDFKIELLDNSNNSVKVVGPVVDSTGRANDLFRRVQSRIDFASTFNYPQATVDIEGNLCKNFSVTDKSTDYKSLCTP